MDYKLAENAVENAMRKFRQSKLMRDWLDYLAIKTWFDLGISQSALVGGLREETLTENILIATCQAMNLFAMPLRIYRSLDEKTNGGDLEIFVPMKNQFVRLAVQAKKVYINKGYTYDAIDHTVKGTGKLQINLLLDYAQKMKAIPLYLFFNYCDDKAISASMLKSTRAAQSMPQFGCSFTDASWVKKQFVSGSPEKWSKKLGITDLHPPSLPFCALDLFRKGYSWGALQTKLGLSVKEDEVHFIDSTELDDDGDWREYVPTPFEKSPEGAIGFLITEENPFNKADLPIVESFPQDPENFSPKFRMVIERGLVGKHDKKKFKK